MLEHGGRLERAARDYGIARETWLDLSTGVSPYGWPVPPIPPRVWQRLPEDDDGLLDAARAYYGVHDLLPVAGSQAAIAALPRLRARSRVAVIEPTYAEHAHTWRQGGHEVTSLTLADLLARVADFDVVIVVRPNNPTGECASREQLVDAMRCRSADTGASMCDMPWLIVDEAFVDTRPQESLLADRCEGLVVLRSVGKFFGLAGARAGFVAAWPALLDALAEALGPWTLSGPTRYALTHALADTAWQATARDRLQQASLRLAALLTGRGLPPSGGCDFFQYVRHDRAGTLHHALARRAVLVRHFATPQALRFGLPADDAAFAQLDRALAEVLA